MCTSAEWIILNTDRIPMNRCVCTVDYFRTDLRISRFACSRTVCREVQQYQNRVKDGRKGAHVWARGRGPQKSVS